MASLAAGWRNGNVVQAITAPIYLRARKNRNRLPSSRRQPNDGLWPRVRVGQRLHIFCRVAAFWHHVICVQSAMTGPCAVKPLYLL